MTNNHGRQQLQVDTALLGNAERGLGAIGAIGARDGHVIADGFEYSQGRAGGFDPHKRIPDMDMDGIDAAFLYPSIGLFVGGIQDPRPRRCDLPGLQPAGLPITASHTRMIRLLRRRDAADAGCRPGDQGDDLRAQGESSASAPVFCGRTRTITG